MLHHIEALELRLCGDEVGDSACFVTCERGHSGAQQVSKGRAPTQEAIECFGCAQDFGQERLACGVVGRQAQSLCEVDPGVDIVEFEPMEEGVLEAQLMELLVARFELMERAFGFFGVEEDLGPCEHLDVALDAEVAVCPALCGFIGSLAREFWLIQGEVELGLDAPGEVGFGEGVASLAGIFEDLGEGFLDLVELSLKEQGVHLVDVDRALLPEVDILALQVGCTQAKVMVGVLPPPSHESDEAEDRFCREQGSVVALVLGEVDGLFDDRVAPGLLALRADGIVGPLEHQGVDVMHLLLVFDGLADEKSLKVGSTHRVDLSEHQRHDVTGIQHSALLGCQLFGLCFTQLNAT